MRFRSRCRHNQGEWTSRITAARILFNLTFFVSICAAIVAAVEWGVAYSFPSALITFAAGLVISFLVGVIQSAISRM